MFSGVIGGYLNKQHDFWAPVETRFQKPLWAAWCVRWSLPSTLHRPSHRRPPSQTECHPGEWRGTWMRHTGKTRALHTNTNSYQTYVQCVCGEADLRHLHVERALIVAQRAYKWTEAASHYSPSSCCFTHLLPSFLSLWGSDLDGIISTHLPWRPQVADMPHPFLSSCLFLSDFPKHWRVASLFIGLPHHHVPATIVLAVHSLYLPFLFLLPLQDCLFSHIYPNRHSLSSTLLNILSPLLSHILIFHSSSTLLYVFVS